MKPDDHVLRWLLDGDVSVQYQVHRDLYGIDKPKLRERIAKEGWGAQFLSKRKKDGLWGRGFYQPKWICTHYTLLDLKNLGISPRNKLIRATLDLIFRTEKAPDGGILPISVNKRSDACVNGMVLNYACFFRTPEEDLKSIIDLLLSQIMKDGGFNCRLTTTGAVHSSLHTTLSVLEGILEYEQNGYTYRLRELQKAKSRAHEFILMHHLFRSDKTGEIIRPSFLKLAYPCRWYYDILRAMDYFRAAGVKHDPRMNDALRVIVKKRTKDGVWKLPSKHPGQTHFDMEQAGQPSRWNTLRALRVLKQYPFSL